MTLGGTPTQWNALATRITNHVAKGDAADAILAITQELFETPHPTKKKGRPRKVTRRQLAKTLVNAVTVKKGAVENACRSTRRAPGKRAVTRRKNSPSQRNLWRLLNKIAVKELQSQLRDVWWLLFQMGRRRFGLMRLGYEVYIDEHQTLVYTRRKKTEVGLLAGASKKDKYAGKFRAWTYQIMVACFRGSRVTIPMDVVLVAKNGPSLDAMIAVPGLSTEDIIARFIGLLEAIYPPPKVILFDRGYHANINYSRVGKYCDRHGCIYMTPAKREATGAFRDEDGKTYWNVEDFIKRNRAKASPLRPGSNIFYVTGERPISVDPGRRRTLIVFYRPYKKGDDLPEGAVTMDATYYAFAFYTNAPNPTRDIACYERLYSRRWTEENWFKKRAANFHGGRAHKALRRVAAFMVGIICLAIYGLMHGIMFPEHDVVALSQYFGLPNFVSDLVDALTKV